MKAIVNPTLIDFSGLMILSAIWGSAFIAVEYALESYDPLLIAFGRISVAFSVLTLFMKIKGLSFPKDSKTWSLMLVIGILNNTIPFFLISWGQQYISASTASIMLAVGPFIALILSHYITHDEKFTFIKLLSVLLGFAGIFILLGDDLINQRHDSLYGEIAMLISVFGYISAGLLLRKMSHLPTVVCSSSMFLVSTLSLIPFILFIPLKSYALLDSTFLWIIYLGLFPTAIASLIRVRLVQKVGIQFMSQVSYLIPIFAIIWSWIFFDELPKSAAWIALVFVLTGLFIRKFGKKL